ncbi:MAG: type VI secretion system baseplate subunit TssE [Gemmatimonadota bacterium]
MERTVRPSVLERLMDDEPGIAADRSLTWAQSVERYKVSVLRDLEWLLNTRRIAEEAPREMEELQRSVYHFGVPDVSSLSADAPGDRQRLAQRLKDAIRTHEPRLADVRIRIPERDEGPLRLVRFVVEGTLRMEPNPEQVVFDTVLEVASGRFRVGGDDA